MPITWVKQRRAWYDAVKATTERQSKLIKFGLDIDTDNPTDAEQIEFEGLKNAFEQALFAEGEAMKAYRKAIADHARATRHLS
jgi:hypothetical protein